MIMCVFCISCVSAGFLDGFFSGESNESNDANASFVDLATKGSKNEDWQYPKNLKVSVTDKGTVLSNNGDGNAFYTVNKPSTSKNDANDLIEWNAPYAVEFDLVSNSGSSILITDGENGSSRTFEQLGANNNSHIKLVNDGSTIQYFINGMSDPVYKFSDKPINPSAIRFVIPQGSSLTYKNFTIY